MKSTTLVRIGASYFVEEAEMAVLMKSYLSKQVALKKQRALQAKLNFSQNALIRLNRKQEKIEAQVEFEAREKELLDKIAKFETKMEKKPSKKSD